ncbi:hypothetical protein [Actinomadura sp. 9N407]|uniref:hypothetical protein n=1 Tax=Actinomadura sp. 9N407 TaxID=3375154 RepID=UPI00378EC97F
MESRARNIRARNIRVLTSSFATMAVLAPVAVFAPSALASPSPALAPVPAAAPAAAETQRPARVRVKRAWVRGRYLHVHGTVRCDAKYDRGRLILIAQQPGGPHVGHKPLKSPGRTKVRCDGRRHHWSTWHSSRSHADAKGHWRRYKRVFITGILIGPKPPRYVDARVIAR